MTYSMQLSFIVKYTNIFNQTKSFTQNFFFCSTIPAEKKKHQVRRKLQSQLMAGFVACDTKRSDI